MIGTKAASEAAFWTSMSQSESENTMTAYVVFMKEEVLDQSELGAYSSKVGKSFDGRDVKVLAAYGSIETIEGPDIEGAVILEFPDLEAARDWYRSPAYQEAAAHRFRGARYRGFIVEGRKGDGTS